jgi:hypothetical protein
MKKIKNKVSSLNFSIVSGFIERGELGYLVGIK